MDPAKETVVAAGPFTIEKLDIKGTTIFKRVDTFYGPKPMITGYGFQLFTNADAAIQALKAGEIDCVYQLPPTSSDTLKGDANLQIEGFGGSVPQTLIVNDSANNKKHPELRELGGAAGDRPGHRPHGDDRHRLQRLRRARRLAAAPALRA